MTGCTRVVLNLAKRHDRARVRPAVCFFSVVPAAHEARATLDAAAVPWRDVVKRSRYDLGAIDRLAGALRELGTEVAALHGFSTHPFGGLAARQAGARAVVRVEHSPELHTPLHRLAARAASAWCDSTVLVSRYLVEYLTAAGVELTAPEVIYNGIELAPFEAITRAPFAGRGGSDAGDGGGPPPVAVMAARLDTAKDHATLLDALAILARRGRALELHLAGDGPFRADLEQRARDRGVADRVRFLGYVSDLPALYASADVAVLATHFEGFGLAVVEAMAAGRPVVATRVAAIPELIDDGVEGLLVPPRAAPALAAALESLLTDPARARAMGAAGRVRARRYALEPFVRAFEAHVERAAAGVA
jgi:glycosyltransferase involved in cell wall biosynthesis